MEKVCFKCERVKPLTDFYEHRNMADGHLNKCKECCKAAVKANVRAKPEYYRKYDSRRAMMSHRIESRREYAANNRKRINKIKADSRKRYPSHVNARNIVARALRLHQLKRADQCEICFCSATRLHGHHEDYSRPLWVAWICSRCHRNIHKGVVTLGRFHHQRKPEAC